MSHARSRTYPKFAIGLAAALMVLTAVGAQLAGPAELDMSWHTVDGGGGFSSAPVVEGTIEITATIGQPEALSTGPLSGGDYEFMPGFWNIPAPVDSCPADVNNDGLVNVNDLLAVINTWGACPPGPCPADVAPLGGDGAVNVNDLLAVINGWGLCP